MANDVQVLYVEPFGTTAQVAMEVAEQLCRRGFRVELRRVARARAREHQAVVLGGATGPDTWHPAAVQYLEDAADHLDLHLFHTDFGTTDEPAELPAEVRALADDRGIGRVPVLPDLDAPSRAAGRGMGTGGRVRLTPALHWADVLADRLRLGQDRLALVG